MVAATGAGELIVKRGPGPTAPLSGNSLEDWDLYLYSLWLEIIKTNPSLYDDAKINHATGQCACRCTGTFGLYEKHKELHKRK